MLKKNALNEKNCEITSYCLLSTTIESAAMICLGVYEYRLNSMHYEVQSRSFQIENVKFI